MVCCKKKTGSKILFKREKHPIPSLLASYGARIDQLVYGSTVLTTSKPRTTASCIRGRLYALLPPFKLRTGKEEIKIIEK